MIHDLVKAEARLGLPRTPWAKAYTSFRRWPLVPLAVMLLLVICGVFAP